MTDEKINLLVLPILFPRGADDILGIFVLDYLRAVREFCNVTVLDVRLSGEPCSGTEHLYGATIIRDTIMRHPPGYLLKPFAYFLWAYRCWRATRKIDRVDVMHAHGTTLTGNLALLLGRIRGVPVVITEHSAPGPRFGNRAVAMAMTKWAAEHADAALFVSKDLERQFHAESIRPRRAIVTHNPVDTELFRPDAKPESGPEEQKNILFVSRLVPFKGALRTLAAFQSVCSRWPAWRLTVIGDGPERQAIEQFIVDHPDLAGRVTIIGQAPKECIADAMRKSAFLVFPSERETFGLVAAEAMASGLPVIVGDAPALREFVDEEAGCFVPSSDVNALADAMEYLMGGGHAFDAEAIRYRIAARFGFAAFGARLREVYEGLM